MSLISRHLLLAFLALPAAACGDDAKPAGDADQSTNFSLEILDPPGDTLGLDFAASAELRVRYVDDQGQPLSGERVSFSLVEGSDGSTGGATLSAESVRADEDGIARVQVVVGSERVNFRVEVSADNARSVLFTVQVSDQGFATLELVSEHLGPRDPASFEPIELQLYSSSDLSCADVDVDDLPASDFNSRQQASIGDSSEYAMLAVDESYAAVALARAGGDRAVSVGCIEVLSESIDSGAHLTAALALRDRDHELQDRYDGAVELDLRPLRDALPGALAWRSLACPLGRAQLLIDCVAAADDGQSPLRCEPEGSGDLSAALLARRGELDAQGCRPAQDGQGQVSIDQLLATQLDTGWPSDVEREALVQGRDNVLERLRITTRLSPDTPQSSRHRLLQAELGSLALDLAASTLPVLEVFDLGLDLGPAFELGLSPHAFTLGFGELATQAYESDALTPANQSGRGDALGSELIDGVSIDAQLGCDALDAFLCNEIGLGAGCADACAALAAPLDELMAAWLTSFDGAPALDLAIEGTIGLEDSDNDLVVDALQTDTGLTGTLSAGDTEHALQGAYLAVPPEAK